MRTRLGTPLAILWFSAASCKHPVAPRNGDSGVSSDIPNLLTETLEDPKLHPECKALCSRGVCTDCLFVPLGQNGCAEACGSSSFRATVALPRTYFASGEQSSVTIERDGSWQPSVARAGGVIYGLPCSGECELLIQATVESDAVTVGDLRLGAIEVKTIGSRGVPARLKGQQVVVPAGTLRVDFSGDVDGEPRRISAVVASEMTGQLSETDRKFFLTGRFEVDKRTTATVTLQGNLLFFPPVARIKKSEMCDGALLKTVLDASQSYDPEGIGVHFTWRRSGANQPTLGSGPELAVPSNAAETSYELVVTNSRNMTTATIVVPPARGCKHGG